MANNDVLAALAALQTAIQAQGENGIDAAAVEDIAGALMDRKFSAALPALLTQCGDICKKSARETVAAAVDDLNARIDKAVEDCKAALAGSVRRVVVDATETRPAVDLGVQHKNFETLFQLCNARGGNGNRFNIYLYGPAGTGKTTAAESVARGIYGENWRDWFHANGAVNSAYDLLGYMDAGGVYHETEFYRAFKNGGVYLFDELDSSSPAAVLAFNQALANGCAAFPCGMVRRHPDCIILAGGNTCMRGDGAGAGYQRVRMDSAFRDRFIFLEWGIDENLELAIVSAFGDVGKNWWARVLKMRKNAAAVGLRDFEITPRATYNGAALLAAGVPEAVVIDSCVRKGLSESQWAKIEA